MEYFWNWNIFFEIEPVTNDIFIIYLFKGALWTVIVAILAWIIAFSVGTLIGTLKTVGNSFIENLCFFYIEIFRNIPLLLQFFLWFYVFPEFLSPELSHFVKNIPPPWASFITAILGLGIFISSRVAEIISSSINSLPSAQVDSAYALGFSKFQMYRHVLLPQALRISIPALTSEMLITLKATSIAMIIGFHELMGRTRSMQEQTFQIFESLIFATIAYLLLNFIIIKIMKHVEKKSSFGAIT